MRSVSSHCRLRLLRVDDVTFRVPSIENRVNGIDSIEIQQVTNMCKMSSREEKIRKLFLMDGSVLIKIMFFFNHYTAFIIIVNNNIILSR